MKKFWIILDPTIDACPRKQYASRREAETAATSLFARSEGYNPVVFQAVTKPVARVSPVKLETYT